MFPDSVSSIREHKQKQSVPEMMTPPYSPPLERDRDRDRDRNKHNRDGKDGSNYHLKPRSRSGTTSTTRSEDYEYVSKTRPNDLSVSAETGGSIFPS